MLFFCIVLAFLVGEVGHPVSPTVAAPGSNATLECPFHTSKHLNLTNLIVNWQYGETVVHSFYLGRDQLDRQGRSYRGRTHLFDDELREGNASLLLTDVRLQDEGEYTCHVNNELGSTSAKLLLILAAPFDEPLLSVQPTCHSINITVTVSNGFPLPELNWWDSDGRAINQTSSDQQDSRGRYKVSSNIDYRPSTVETITLEMKLEVLKQSFTRSLLLHPPPDPCQECCRMPPLPQNRTPVAVVVVILFIAAIIVIFLVKKRKRKSHGEQDGQEMEEQQSTNLAND